MSDGQEVKAAHTPGPWRRVHDHPNIECTNSIAYIRPTNGALLRDEIATLYSCDDDPEQSANANLIAAAPELLVALRDLVARCDGHAGVLADGSNIDTLAAHVAIAKAEESATE